MKHLYYCLLPVLMACAGNHQQLNVDNKQVTTPTQVEATETELPMEAKNELTLQTLSSLPQSVSGCRGLFATDTTALHGKQYLFASNPQGKAYIKVRGRIIVLKLDDKIDQGALTKEIYKGSGYTMHVVLHKIREINEDKWLYTGELLLLKSNQQESKSVIGEIGC